MCPTTQWAWSITSLVSFLPRTSQFGMQRTRFPELFLRCISLFVTVKDGWSFGLPIILLNSLSCVYASRHSFSMSGWFSPPMSSCHLNGSGESLVVDVATVKLPGSAVVVSSCCIMGSSLSWGSTLLRGHLAHVMAAMWNTSHSANLLAGRSSPSLSINKSTVE